MFARVTGQEREKTQEQCQDAHMIRQLFFLKGLFRYRQFVESRRPIRHIYYPQPARRFFTAFVHSTRSLHQQP